MPKIDLNQLEGGPALCDWFGSSPTFHDATLYKLKLRQGADSVLVANIFEAGPDVDSNGYNVQRKHAAVTLTLSELIDVELHDFMKARILCGLDIERDAEGVTLSFDSSYGVYGRIKAKEVRLSFAPTEPARARPA